MVTISGYRLSKGKDDKEFIALELQGDVELIQSIGTGRFYATARRASITSTFKEEVAKSLIGTKLSGSIKRVESDPYYYTVAETGEVIKLAHKYEYSPEEGVPYSPPYTPPSSPVFSLRKSLQV